VFQALLPYAVEELCNVAESLIVPVRMGIARPTAPFTLASTSIDAMQGSEELFSVEPLPPRPSSDQASRYVNVLYGNGLSGLLKLCFGVAVEMIFTILILSPNVSIIF
jgi:E3 ubiquitin-protein ligase EDD1